MSKGVASSGTSSRSWTKTNSACASMKRRISQAHAVRSTWTPARVAHFIAHPPCRSRRQAPRRPHGPAGARRSEEHTSELQSRQYLVCRLLLEKKKKHNTTKYHQNTKTKNTK